MPPAPEALDLVSMLSAELRASGVRYCHWKSTTTLSEALLGHGDLDLLVDRADASRFQEVAGRCGFTRTRLQRSTELPSVDHMHGLDHESGRLVHLHVHHQLVLGHDTTKNHRLPLERAFLDAADTNGGVVPVPPVELELAVLVLRIVLKYGTVDEVIWRGLRGRSAGPTTSERDELADLSSRADRRVLREVVERDLRFLPAGVFDACEQVAAGLPSLSRRLLVGRALRRALDVHARHGAAADAARRVKRRLEIASLRRSGRMPRFSLNSGGAVVAVIGGDGAGKSTLLDSLEGWLQDDFDVHRIHVGRPPWSRTTTSVRAVLKSIAMVMPDDAGRRAPTTDTAPAPGFAHLRANLWHACTARDRHLVHRRAKRLAHRGWLVLTDRYPHENLREMDVPQIRRSDPRGGADGMTGLLARLEEAYHARIPAPDVLVVLTLAPDVAVARKTDEPPDYVHRRSTEVWTADWDGANAYVVDAERQAEEVALDVRRLLWSRLT